MRLATLLFSLLASAAPAIAQPYEPYDDGVDIDGSIYADINVNLSGSEVPDISLFFDRLAPFGSWYDDSVYGYVFAPADPYYTPYSNGYWRYTQFGWTWISNDQFGWATDHYGRWVWRNRWVWKPDTQWGPAWVQWREGDNGYVGWAPLGYDVNAYIPETHWRFIPTIYITSRDLPRHYVRSNYSRYVRDTRPVVRWNRSGNHRWVAGPDRSYLDRHKVTVQRDDRYNLREIGRLDAQERRQAEQRATQARVRYRERLQREAQVRADLDRKRVEVERRQVEQQRQRVRTQPRADQRATEQQRQRTQQEQQRRQIEQRDQREGAQRQRDLDQRAKAQRDAQVREQAQRQTRQKEDAARRQVEQRQRQQRQQVEQRQQQQRQQVEQQKRQQVEQRKQQNEARQQQQRQQVEQRKQQNEARQQQQRQQVEERKQQAQQRQQHQRQQVEERRDQKQKQRSEERQKPRSQNDKRDKRDK